jgi:CTP:molybdopterin cytidylyltransferase MocA
MAIQIHAVMLAAGQSTRMGHDKAQCLLHGVPWLNILHTTLIQLQTRLACLQGMILMTSSKHAVTHEMLLKKNEDTLLHHLSLKIVINEQLNSDMMDSILYAYQQSTSSWFLLCPIDCPAISVETLVDLVHGIQQSHHVTMQMYCPSYRGERGHPVLVHRDVLKMIAHQRKLYPHLRAWQNAHALQIVDVAVEDAAILHNWNKPF